MSFFEDYKKNLFLNLFLVYVIWGSTYLGVKIGLQDLTPLLLTGIRFTIGGLLLLVFAIIKNGLPKLDEAKGSGIIGIFLTGIGTSSVSYAINYIPSGLVAMLVALLPVWTFLLDFSFFSKKRPSAISGLGMIIGLVGVLFLFNPIGLKGEIGVSQLFPICIIFIGSLAWAYGSLISIKTKQSGGFTGVSIQMLSGGCIALLASLALEQNQLEAISGMQIESISAMSYLIFIGSYIGYSAYVWLINNAPPILVSSYAFVNPVIAIFLGYYLAQEKLSDVSVIACFIILIGVVFMTLGRRRKGEF